MDENQLYYGAKDNPKNGIKVIDTQPFFEHGLVTVNLTNKTRDQVDKKVKVPQAKAYLKIRDLNRLLYAVLYDQLDTVKKEVSSANKTLNIDKRCVFYSHGGGYSKRIGKQEARIFQIWHDSTRDNPFTIKLANGVGAQAKNQNKGLLAMADLTVEENKKHYLSYEYYMIERETIEFLDSAIKAHERYKARNELLTALAPVLEGLAKGVPLAKILDPKSKDTQEIEMETRDDQTIVEDEPDTVNTNTVYSTANQVSSDEAKVQTNSIDQPQHVDYSPQPYEGVAIPNLKLCL